MLTDDRPVVRILGTHGIPAAYGGFETAAENVALFLVEHGWRVIVYCQIEGSGEISHDEWRGIERVNIPVNLPGWRGTSYFDLRSVKHAAAHDDVCLVFGYNTAIFNVWQRLKRTPLLINMDGIEWSRARWGFARQAILYINERIAAAVGHQLIADHPEIERYLWSRAPRRKVSMITYGAHEVLDASTAPLEEYGLVPGGYLTLVCRPIPENSILELVAGFSAKQRGCRLLVVGPYDPESDAYHRALMDAASAEVQFPGAIFDQERLQALRFHSKMYLHGHTVGGTNPSLVEALAAGNPVLAHDNAYNRWTAGATQRYFRSAADVEQILDELLEDDVTLLAMGTAARARFRAEFTWEHVAGQYEAALRRLLPRSVASGQRGPR